MIVHSLQDARSDGTRVASVGVKGLDDFLDGNGGLSYAPRVIVGSGADEGVAIMISREPARGQTANGHSLQLGLTSEFGLGNDRHVDDVSAPLTVHD